MEMYKPLSVCEFKDSNKVLMDKVENLEGCVVNADTTCHPSTKYPKEERGSHFTKLMKDVFHETIGL